MRLSSLASFFEGFYRYFVIVIFVCNLCSYLSLSSNERYDLCFFVGIFQRRMGLVGFLMIVFGCLFYFCVCFCRQFCCFFFFFLIAIIESWIKDEFAFSFLFFGNQFEYIMNISWNEKYDIEFNFTILIVMQTWMIRIHFTLADCGWMACEFSFTVHFYFKIELRNRGFVFLIISW